MLVALLLLLVGVGIATTPIGAQEVSEAEPLPGLLPVPDPLPPGEPGDVIASAPFPSGAFPFTVEVHQILFHTTDRTGADIAVSGYVLVPTGVPAPTGGRGVVAWAHGTTGLVDGCAPSLDGQDGGRLNAPDSYDRIVQTWPPGMWWWPATIPGSAPRACTPTSTEWARADRCSTRSVRLRPSTQRAPP